MNYEAKQMQHAKENTRNKKFYPKIEVNRNHLVLSSILGKIKMRSTPLSLCD